jgi:anti-sigma factor RsiW
MKEEHLHISDEQLLLHACGEVPASRSSQIQVHLETCSQCRNRLQELQSTLAEFGEVHRNAWDAVLPPVDERRAQLRTRLAELAEQERRSEWFGLTWMDVVEHRSAAAVRCRHRLDTGKNLICA